MLMALRGEHARLREQLQAIERRVREGRWREHPVERALLLDLVDRLPSVPGLLHTGRRHRLFGLTRLRCPPIGAVLERCAQRLDSMQGLREAAQGELRGAQGDVQPDLEGFVEGVLGQLAVLDDYILPVATYYLIPEDWIELARLPDGRDAAEQICRDGGDERDL